MKNFLFYLVVCAFIVGCDFYEIPESDIDLDESVVCSNVQTIVDNYSSGDSDNMILTTKEYQNLLSSLILKEVKLELGRKNVEQKTIDQVTVESQINTSERLVEMPFEETPYKHVIEFSQGGIGALPTRYFFAYENFRFVIVIPISPTVKKYLYMYNTRTVTFSNWAYWPGHYMSWDVRYMQTTLDIDGKTITKMFNRLDYSTYNIDTLFHTQSITATGKKDSVVTSTHHVINPIFEIKEENIFRKLVGFN